MICKDNNNCSESGHIVLLGSIIPTNFTNIPFDTKTLPVVNVQFTLNVIINLRISFLTE